VCKKKLFHLNLSSDYVIFCNSRCSFHAYADSTYAKHLESSQSLNGTLDGLTPTAAAQPRGERGPDTLHEYQQSVIEMSDDSFDRFEDWKAPADTNGYSNNGSAPGASPKRNGEYFNMIITALREVF
jgi:hypothetical protein